MKLKKIKILYLIPSLSIGGAEKTLVKIVNGLNINKYQLFILTLKEIGPLKKDIVKSNIQIKSIKEFNSRGILLIYHLIQYVKKIEPDIIHTWMYHSDLIGSFLAKFVNCNKVIWSIRNTEIISSGISNSARFSMKICSFLSKRFPKKIICVGQKAKTIHQNYGYDPSKMIVIGNGFDIEISKNENSQLRDSLGISSNAILIGSIGRFNKYKNQKTFISSASLIASQFQNVYFIMAGKNIDYQNKELVKWIDNTGYKGKFKLLGECKNVNYVLDNLDIFCLHSISEGFPNILGEAMASQKACITTDVGEAAFLLGNAGVVVAHPNSKELTKGLIKLIKLSSSKRRELGEKAYARIKEKFLFDDILNQYDQLYHQVFCN